MSIIAEQTVDMQPLFYFEREWLKGVGVDEAQMSGVPASTFRDLYHDLLYYGPNHEVILEQAAMLKIQLNDNALSMRVVNEVEALIDNPKWYALEHSYYYYQNYLTGGKEERQAVDRVSDSFRKLGQATWYLSPYQRRAGGGVECYPLSVSFFGLLGPGVFGDGTTVDFQRIEAEGVILDAFNSIRTVTR